MCEISYIRERNHPLGVAGCKENNNCFPTSHLNIVIMLGYFSDLKPDDFPLEFWESGAVYFHNHDKDGHKICEYGCLS